MPTNASAKGRTGRAVSDACSLRPRVLGDHPPAGAVTSGCQRPAKGRRKKSRPLIYTRRQERKQCWREEIQRQWVTHTVNVIGQERTGGGAERLFYPTIVTPWKSTLLFFGLAKAVTCARRTLVYPEVSQAGLDSAGTLVPVIDAVSGGPESANGTTSPPTGCSPRVGGRGMVP